MADRITGVQRIRGSCGLCIARCGTIATVEDGRFTRLDPDPEHPTGHALCAKGQSQGREGHRAHGAPAPPVQGR